MQKDTLPTFPVPSEGSESGLSCDSFPPIYLMCCLTPIFTIIEWLAFQGLTHFLPAFLGAFLFAVVGYFCDSKNLCFCCGLMEAVALGSDPGTMGAYTGAGEGSTWGSTWTADFQLKGNYFYQIISNVQVSSLPFPSFQLDVLVLFYLHPGTCVNSSLHGPFARVTMSQCQKLVCVCVVFFGFYFQI